MFKRFMLIGLLVISVSAMLMTEANAGCPVGYIYIGGSCYKTKGVDCEVDLKHLGNVDQHPKSLECNIFPLVQETGLLFCGNRASNQPPGIVPVIFTGSFGGSEPINPQDVGKNGTAHVKVIALLSDQQLKDLGDANCPNAQNWTALDFVPCKFTSELNLVNDETLKDIETAKHFCSLPNCETLKWDKKLQMPEQRDYDCTGPIQ